MTTPSYLGKRVRSSAFLTPYYLGKRQDVGTDVDPNTLYPVSEHHSFIDGKLMHITFNPHNYDEIDSVIAEPGETFILNDKDRTLVEQFWFDFFLARPVSNPILRVFFTGEADFQKKEDWVEIGQSTTPSIHTDTRLTFNDAVTVTIPTSLYGDTTDGYESGLSRRRIVFAAGDDNTPYLYSYTEWRTFHPTAIKPHGMYYWVVNTEGSQQKYDDFIISPNASNQLLIPSSTLFTAYSYIETWAPEPDLKGHGHYWDYPYGTAKGQPFPPNMVWTTIQDKPWAGVVWGNNNAGVTLTQSDTVNHDGKELYAHVKAGTSTTDWSDIVYHIKMKITIRVMGSFDPAGLPSKQSKTSIYDVDYRYDPSKHNFVMPTAPDSFDVVCLVVDKANPTTILGESPVDTSKLVYTFNPYEVYAGFNETLHFARLRFTPYCPSKPSLRGTPVYCDYKSYLVPVVLNTNSSALEDVNAWTQPPTSIANMNNRIESFFSDGSGNSVLNWRMGIHTDYTLSTVDYNTLNLTVYMTLQPNHLPGRWHHPNWAFVKGDIETSTERCYANRELSTWKWAMQVALDKPATVIGFRWRFHTFSGPWGKLDQDAFLYLDGVGSPIGVGLHNTDNVTTIIENSANGNSQSRTVTILLGSPVTATTFDFLFPYSQSSMRDFEFLSG